MRNDRRRVLRGLGAALAASATRSAVAQAPYPTRPIRIIVPSTAAGPYDIIPRLVADYVSRKYGWTIVAENRPGASGIVGVVAAKQAAPDGYTLVVPSAATHGSEPAFNHALPYDPYNDLAPIVLLAQCALVLLVRKDMRVNSVPELLSLIRARPGMLKFSSAGYLTQQHLAVAMMLQRAGLPQDACTHVPYRGLVEAVRGLLAGEADFMIVSTGSVRGYIANGDLRALAITTPARSPRLPDVPTFAEIGYPGYQIVAWCALAAPAGTPQPILDRWNTVTNEALTDTDVRAHVEKLDYDVCGGSAASYTAFFKRDIETYRQLAAATGLKEE
ncbi:MAG TPA: tripartite tricarboxylate transporter substrate binding protein [Xanthobacteraceae bacterium]|nr:tripartite tricarboxylate transporter substrate binding protein [Xanthobacteraceae bacterium]